MHELKRPEIFLDLVTNRGRVLVTAEQFNLGRTSIPISQIRSVQIEGKEVPDWSCCLVGIGTYLIFSYMLGICVVLELVDGNRRFSFSYETEAKGVAEAIQAAIALRDSRS